jgi:hypothetical protein
MHLNVNSWMTLMVSHDVDHPPQNAFFNEDVSWLLQLEGFVLRA